MKLYRKDGKSYAEGPQVTAGPSGFLLVNFCRLSEFLTAPPLLLFKKFEFSTYSTSTSNICDALFGPKLLVSDFDVFVN